MAGQSQAVLAAGAAGTPVDYVVPGNALIQLRSVKVEYVDSGAAIDWMPSVQILSDSGHLMVEAADQNVQVVAGNDARVSFFPGVKHAAAAAVALNLPWGYCRYDNAAFPSNVAITQVDFNPAVGLFGGFTSGDPDITFGANPTGRWSLILNTTGYYLMGTGFTCQVAAAPAAGSAAFLNSQWLPGRPIAGMRLMPFTQVPGSLLWLGDPARIDVFDADGVNQAIPKSGNTGIAQNSGLNASVHVYQFAVKISDTFVVNQQ